MSSSPPSQEKEEKHGTTTTRTTVDANSDGEEKLYGYKDGDCEPFKIRKMLVYKMKNYPTTFVIDDSIELWTSQIIEIIKDHSDIFMQYIVQSGHRIQSINIIFDLAYGFEYRLMLHELGKDVRHKFMKLMQRYVKNLKKVTIGGQVQHDHFEYMSRTVLRNPQFNTSFIESLAIMDGFPERDPDTGSPYNIPSDEFIRDIASSKYLPNLKQVTIRPKTYDLNLTPLIYTKHIESFHIFYDSVDCRYGILNLLDELALLDEAWEQRQQRILSGEQLPANDDCAIATVSSSGTVSDDDDDDDETRNQRHQNGEGVRLFSSLTKLSIRWLVSPFEVFIPFLEVRAMALLEVIRKNVTLQEINLETNVPGFGKLWSSKTNELSDALSQNKTLRNLHVLFPGGSGGRPPKPSQQQRLIEVLKNENFKLGKFRSSNFDRLMVPPDYYNLSDDEYPTFHDELNYYLELNQCGRDVVVGQNKEKPRPTTDNDWFHLLLNNTNSLHWIYYILRKEPILCSYYIPSAAAAAAAAASAVVDEGGANDRGDGIASSALA